MRRPKSRTFLVLTLAALLGSTMSSAAENAVVGEVLTMLEGGLDESVIVGWLEAGEPGFPRPNAAELVSLSKAGASSDLLQLLIERSTLEEPPVENPPAASVEERAPAPAPPEPAPKAEPAPVASPPESQANRAAPVVPVAEAQPVREPRPAAAGGAETAVTFRLRYAPRFDEDEEEWGLYVYLDGKPLSYVPQTSAFQNEVLEFSQRLAPGRHVVRVAQERHRKRRKGDRHETRVAPQSFEFEVGTDGGALVQLDFRQSLIDLGRSSGPLTFSATREGSTRSSTTRPSCASSRPASSRFRWCSAGRTPPRTC